MFQWQACPWSFSGRLTCFFVSGCLPDNPCLGKLCRICDLISFFKNVHLYLKRGKDGGVFCFHLQVCLFIGLSSQIWTKWNLEIQEMGTSSEFPVRVTGVQPPGPACAVFSDALAGCWSWSAASRTPVSPLIWHTVSQAMAELAASWCHSLWLYLFRSGKGGYFKQL